MNAVEEAVRNLGKAIQADPRYTAYHAAKAANDGDEALQGDIQAFNLKRMSYQHEMEKPDDQRDNAKMQQLEAQVQEIYDRIVANPHMAAFQAAKEAMDAMMQEVDMILTLCANGEDPDTCHPDLSNCTGNCASCGGCH